MKAGKRYGKFSVACLAGCAAVFLCVCIFAVAGGATQTYASELKLANAPTVVLDVTDKAALDGISSKQRKPSNAILRFDKDCKVAGANGETLGDFASIYQSVLVANGVLPVLRVADEAAANAAIKYLGENPELTDIAVTSQNADLVKKVRTACQKIRGIVEYAPDTKLHDLVSVTNSSYANVAVVPQSMATVQNVRYVHARFKTVWVIPESTDKFDLYDCAGSGAYGIVSPDTDSVYDALGEYEADYQTGMDIKEIAQFIYDYTSGYPFLVSRLCKIIDEQIVGTEDYPDKPSAWTKDGFQTAVRMILYEPNTLFDDMRKKFDDYPELSEMIYAVLFTGKSIAYNPDNLAMDMGIRFGFIKCVDEQIVVSNRIFEMRLYNYYLSEDMLRSSTYSASLQIKNQFIHGNNLDMELILRKFVEHFTDIYADSPDKFVEENGRRLFLLYLKPIINGTGNYYIESRTRSMGRTDVIVDYLGQQYIIEMKIYHGKEYNLRGENQLIGYLEDYHLQKGYMLSFNFNKKKQVGVRKIIVGEKTLIEAIV